jgi:hypothetical protein
MQPPLQVDKDALPKESKVCPTIDDSEGDYFKSTNLLSISDLSKALFGATMGFYIVVPLRSTYLYNTFGKANSILGIVGPMHNTKMV